MDCTQLAEIFAGDRADDLDDAASKAFDEHLNSCQTCLDRLADAEAELAPLTEWEPPHVSELEWARVKQGIDKQLATPEQVQLQPRSSVPMFLALAATLLFVAGLAFLIMTPQRTTPGVGEMSNITTESSPAAGDSGAQVLSVSPGDGYVTEQVDVDGVPVVVIKKKAD